MDADPASSRSTFALSVRAVVAGHPGFEPLVIS